jgi:hypothetical protein
VSFYQQVLGLQSPWKLEQVEQVELDMAAQRVVVHVGLERGDRGTSGWLWVMLGFSAFRRALLKPPGGYRVLGRCGS